MKALLTRIGLAEPQADAYLYLLDYASGRKPSQAADALGMTRSNAYKVLDQLCHYDLARKSEVGKTYRYFAEDPIALTSFVAEARNRARELESAVKDSMGELQKKYQKKIRHAEVSVAYGKTALLQAYAKQIVPDGTLYFIRSRADIPFMGFETMHNVRIAPANKNMERFGIVPGGPEAKHKRKDDAKSRLIRKEIDSHEYTSPVEWTVSEDEIAIVNFTDSGTAIRIHDPTIAESFRQIWKALGRRLD